MSEPKYENEVLAHWYAEPAGAPDGMNRDVHPEAEQERTVSLDEWAYELALIIAKARFGPGVDMGGKHNPRPSEEKAARQFVEDFAAALAQRDREGTT